MCLDHFATFNPELAAFDGKVVKLPLIEIVKSTANKSFMPAGFWRCPDGSSTPAQPAPLNPVHARQTVQCFGQVVHGNDTVFLSKPRYVPSGETATRVFLAATGTTLALSLEA